MSFITNGLIADFIIEAFSESSQLSALALHEVILKKKKRCTLRAVYKELGKLEANSIVVKKGDVYSLSLSWILRTISFSEKLYQQHTHPSNMEHLIPSTESHLTWRFNNLKRLDSFWIQLMFVLFEHTGANSMFEWTPHFWFHLLHFEKELEVIDALAKAGKKIFMIIGADTYLDRLGERYWRKDVYEWSFSKGPFHQELDKYYSVIGDYIITIKLDNQTVGRISNLFESVKSKKDIDPSVTHAALYKPTRASLRIEHNKKKALQHRKKFCDFFGI